VRRLFPFLLLALLAVPSAAQARTHWLDTYERNAKRYIGPLRTETLDRNDPYVATVRGTFSIFDAGAYKLRYCGKAEPRPIYRSPNRRNGPVNSDAEFLFANDVMRSCAAGETGISGQRFQIAVGGRYVNYDPFGRGPLTAPHPSHRYKYALIGQGRKVGFRIPETNGADNYGRIRIEINRARASDCTAGFAAFGYLDEAQCVAAVAAARS
jgi:hypothetical protein